MELFPSFDVDIDQIVHLVKDKEYSSVLLQVPEGMKRGALELAGRIERDTRSNVIVDGELCYGACDHAGTRAKLLGIDAVIHLGHSDIPSMKSVCSVPLHFFHAPMKLPDGLIEKGLDQILDSDGSETFGLAAPIQHVDHLKQLSVHIENNGRRSLIGEPTPREEFPGQVLGCSFGSPRKISDKVEAYIYLGTGSFHPLGMISAVKKRVWALDPMTGSATEFGQDDLDGFLRKRFAAITAVKELIDDGAKVGIVVGTKPGQMRKELADGSLDECRKKGANCTLVVMDLLDPMKLRSLGIEVAVVTACPRIAYDDISRYREENVVVITANELQIAIGNKEWDNYSFDEMW